MSKFIIFTKESCGPCGLVKKYFNALKDDRTSIIEEVYLDDFADTPIPQENLDLAKKYSVTATPVLIIVDEEGELLETYTGGMGITQNIRKLFDKYGVEKMSEEVTNLTLEVKPIQAYWMLQVLTEAQKAYGEEFVPERITLIREVIADIDEQLSKLMIVDEEETDGTV